jgi:uncharacterized membrane protein
LVPPRWVPLTTTVVCLLALADSAYLTYSHFTSTPPAFCPSTGGVIDCGLVTSSTYSHPFGVPIVIPGDIWCTAMLVLCSPWAWRAASLWANRLRLAGSAAGVAMVLWLVYVEVVKLRHICEYCTGVHVLTVALFVIIVFATALGSPAGRRLGDPVPDDPVPDDPVPDDPVPDDPVPAGPAQGGLGEVAP